MIGGVQKELGQMGSQYDYASFYICIKLSKNKSKSLKNLPHPKSFRRLNNVLPFSNTHGRCYVKKYWIHEKVSRIHRSLIWFALCVSVFKNIAG